MSRQDNFKERIQRCNSISIVRVLKDICGVEVTPGRNMRCPFPEHNDGKPSAKLYESNNSMFCFGCKRGGKPVDVVMGIRGYQSVGAAVKAIEEHYGLSKLNTPKALGCLREQANDIASRIRMRYGPQVKKVSVAQTRVMAHGVVNKCRALFDSLPERHRESARIDWLSSVLTLLSQIEKDSTIEDIHNNLEVLYRETTELIRNIQCQKSTVHPCLNKRNTK